MNKKNIISTLLISSIVVSPIFMDNQIFAQNNKKVSIESSIESSILAKIERKINTQKMMHDVQKLAIGDNARVAGFYGEEDAADYIVKEFKKLGIKADKQEFDLGRTAKLELSDLSINGKDYAVKGFSNSNSANNLTGEVVCIDTADINEIDLSNKIVLFKNLGSSGNEAKVKASVEKGAIGAIIYTNGDAISTDSKTYSIPTIGIFNSDGNDFVSRLEKGEKLTANIDLDWEFAENAVSYNVVGEIPATKNPKQAQTIIIGAHFDSVSGPGANDNATGTAVLVEAARILSDKSMKMDLNYNIRFVAFGAEEGGLVGSKTYVEQLKASGEIDNIRAMINMDMVGVGDTMSFNYHPDFEESHKEVSEIAKNHAKSIGVDKLFGEGIKGSDHRYFAEAGVPYAYLEWQYGPDEDGYGIIDPNYHTDNDVKENIDSNNLYNTARVLIGTVLEMQSLPNR